MAKFISKRDESIRLFQNPMLEYFSRLHPAVPVVVYLPVCGYFFVGAGSSQGFAPALAGLLGGLLLWTLVEYWFHRALFHYQPKTGWGKRISFLVHGIHHDYPQDSSRLVMPLLVSVPLALAFGGFFRLAFGAWYAGPFAGFTLGYVVYDSLHYAVHHLRLPGRLGRWIKRHHLRHHFTEEHAGYGVTSPLWDLVFRTMPPRRTSNRAGPAEAEAFECLTAD
jgi:dihydroceramide fatty acyl 2-hydroxylase